MSFWLEDDDDNNHDVNNNFSNDANYDPWSQQLLSQSQSQQLGSDSFNARTSRNSSISHTNNNVNGLSQSKSQQPQPQSQSQQSVTVVAAAVGVVEKGAVIFQCLNCGSTECYYDDATGTDICNMCYTQSQHMINATQQDDDDNNIPGGGGETGNMDWEDVMGLAARTKVGGRLVQQHKKKKTSNNNNNGNDDIYHPNYRRIKRNPKQPLEDIDQSIVLPNLQICCSSIQHILTQSIHILVYTICKERFNTIIIRDTTPTTNNNNDTGDDVNHDDQSSDNNDAEEEEERQREDYFFDDNHNNPVVQDQQQRRDQLVQLNILESILLHTVQNIWKSYLYAWSYGAQYYGTKYPYIRFCFRDYFLSSHHVGYITKRYIPHSIIKMKQQEEKEEEEKDHETYTSTSNTTNYNNVHNHSNKVRVIDQKQNNMHNSTDDDSDSESDDNNDEIRPDPTKSTIHNVPYNNEHDDDDNDDEESNNNINKDDGSQNPIDDNGSNHSNNNNNKDIVKRASNTFRMEYSIKSIIQKHTRKKTKGYKEVALLLRPSMTMIASILYLAILKHGTPTTTIIGENNDNNDYHDNDEHDSQTNANISIAKMLLNGLTPIDVCDWINTGLLPLMNAYQYLLSSELQHQVRGIAGFYRIDHFIDPKQIQNIITKLSVICRLRIQPKQLIQQQQQQQSRSNPIHNDNDADNNNIDDTTTMRTIVGQQLTVPTAIVSTHRNASTNDTVRQWSMSNLPYIIARLVAKLGLDQGVLDRSLQLIGYTIPPSPISTDSKNCTNENGTIRKIVRVPTIIPAIQLSTIDELLAIITIACQLDEKWREWIYTLQPTVSTNDDNTTTAPSSSPLTATINVPWNESEYRLLLRNGPSFDTYLKYINRHVLPDGDHNNTNNNSSSNGKPNTSILPQSYINAMELLQQELQGSLRNNASQSIDDDNDYFDDDDVENTNNDDDDGNHENNKHILENTIRPCRILGGGIISQEKEFTNRTKTKNRLGMSDINTTTRIHNSSSTTTTTTTTTATTKKPTLKQHDKEWYKYLKYECDEIHVLPSYDFYQGDRCTMYDYIPNSSTGGNNNDYKRNRKRQLCTSTASMTHVGPTIDDDLIRLVQYIGYVMRINPYTIHYYMKFFLSYNHYEYSKKMKRKRNALQTKFSL